jgi:hypothetical protein
VASLGGNQLDHLKELLPEYPHSIFYSAHIAKSQNLIEVRASFSVMRVTWSCPVRLVASGTSLRRGIATTIGR